MEEITVFMQDYLAKWIDMQKNRNQYFSSLYSKFFSSDYIEQYQQYHLSRLEIAGRIQFTILHININDTNADVIALQRSSYDYESRRYRYHLIQTALGWRIDRQGKECHFCKGAGVNEREICFSCHGDGWKYHGASAKSRIIGLAPRFEKESS